jgi:prephenate dehydratase
MGLKNYLKKIYPLQIAMQGSVGSFNHLAVKKFLAYEDLAYELLPSGSVEKVFTDLKMHKASVGHFAVYNNLAGFVEETLKTAGKEKFEVLGTFEMDIDHFLLGKAELRSIKKVYSHPHALKQCSDFLTKLDAEIIEWSDTAQSASDLKDGIIDHDTSAVIAPSICAQLYNLNILSPSIQNTISRTGFWWIRLLN